jgi:AcrR family transcriptional regulator
MGGAFEKDDLQVERSFNKRSVCYGAFDVKEWTDAMRYHAQHKEETRKRLVESARALTKREGFGPTGVDAMMKSIGLTGGAFYGHFGCKDALFAEILLEEIENSRHMLAGDADSPPDQVARCIRRYLSSAHAANPETGCFLPTLGPEVARAGPEVRARVEAGLKKIERSWSKRLDDPDAGWALIAQCVGALVIARSVESERTRKEILACSRRFLGNSLGLDASAPSAAGRPPSGRGARGR